jgi:putative ABC transport system substrate-binding protein
MRRRQFITALGGAAAWPLVARAQQPGKVSRIGVVCPISCETSSLRSFREALAALGYKDGANLVFEYRSAAGDLKRRPGLTNELVRKNVDVIFTAFGTAAALAAKRATASIPVVVGSAGDLVAAGIVESLNRPGGNITGVTSLLLELEGKRLQLLKEFLPDVSRIAFFRDTTNPYSVLAIERVRTAAAQLGIELREILVHETTDVDQAFATMVGDGLTALCVDAYIPLLASRDRIVELATKHRIAAIYTFRDFVDAGGLFSYGPNLNENAKRAAGLVGKILAAAKPADLPVERSTTVELVINLKTAKVLGLAVPPSIIARADAVVE